MSESAENDACRCARTVCTCGDFNCASLDVDDTPRVPCSIAAPHDPHFWISAIAGGPAGPIPQITCLCSGRAL